MISSINCYEIGGVKAVIWTDVFQLLAMMIGLIIVIVVGCALNGGFVETLYTASKGGRLEIFNMSLNPFVKYTFFNTISYGFITYLRIYGVEQYSVQRIYSVKSVKDARKVLTFKSIWDNHLDAFNIFFRIALVTGAVYIGLAILASNTKGLAEITIKVAGAYSGPVVGVFLIGFFLPKCNIKGVWTGFILSYVMVLWITIGSLIYKTPTKMLPFSADECNHDHLNFTSLTNKNDQK
ncbi:hypothetical protein Avbf_10842 [Armadillidium vulgare]|nr:hypothetical protein Avbf_10842 [Armadillidium vulgare]